MAYSADILMDWLFYVVLFLLVSLWGTGKRPMAGISLEEARGTGGLPESSFPEDLFMWFRTHMGPHAAPCVISFCSLMKQVIPEY